LTVFGNLSFCDGVRTHEGPFALLPMWAYSRRNRQRRHMQKPRMRFPQQTQTVRRPWKGCRPLD